MTETYLGQINIDGEWKDYARGHRDESFHWAEKDPENRRVVHWIYKERVLWANGEATQVRGEFTLTVRFGNDAMQTTDDLARALRNVADTVEVTSPDDLTHTRTILDLNGQRVGGFKFTPED